MQEKFSMLAAKLRLIQRLNLYLKKGKMIFRLMLQIFGNEL